jgi:hypothetical protein
VIDEIAFFEQLVRTWKGPEHTWQPTSGMESIRQLADGHMVPCASKDVPIDPTLIATLVVE